MSYYVVVKEDISPSHMSKKAQLITVLWSIKLHRVKFSFTTDIFRLFLCQTGFPSYQRGFLYTFPPFSSLFLLKLFLFPCFLAFLIHHGSISRSYVRILRPSSLSIWVYVSGMPHVAVGTRKVIFLQL